MIIKCPQCGAYLHNASEQAEQVEYAVWPIVYDPGAGFPPAAIGVGIQAHKGNGTYSPITFYYNADLEWTEDMYGRPLSDIVTTLVNRVLPCSSQESVDSLAAADMWMLENLCHATHDTVQFVWGRPNQTQHEIATAMLDKWYNEGWN